MQVKVISDITTEPVSLETAKAWLKVDEALASEDALITLCVKAARRHCEKYSGLSFGPKTLEAKLPYTRTTNEAHTLLYGPNQVITNVENAEGLVIVPDSELGSTWYAEYLKGMSINNTYKEDYWAYGNYGYCPQDYLSQFYYTVTYTAGYADGQLPDNLQMAVLKMTAELYENRGNSVTGTIIATLPDGVRALLDMEKESVLFA